MLSVNQNICEQETAVPELSNKQHEAFAQALHNGLTVIEAYETAGFKRVHAEAKILAAQADIKARVAELDAMEQALTEVEDKLTVQMFEDLVNPKSVSHAYAIMQAYRNMVMARSLGDIGHANKALEMICKLRGLFDNPDLPDEVKKEKRNGQLTNPNAEGQKDLPTGFDLVARLGDLSGHMSPEEGADSAAYVEIVDGFDGSE